MDEKDNRYPEIATIRAEAKAHIDHREFEKAIGIYRYILIRYADQPEAIEHASAHPGDVYPTTGDLVQAQTHLKHALAMAPKNAQYHYALGFTYSKARNWRKAIAELKKA